MSASTSHQALYRRWRAQTFGQIVGQEAIITTLRNAVRHERVAHAVLFVGPRGTGKTSTARILAKALNCLSLKDGEPCDRCVACDAIREGRALDVVEMDAASNNKVDDIRDLLPRIYTAPSDLRRKVFIIDEVQRITQGWDLLLKTLEEPPPHVAFIFCTTDASQIRPAVLSRVQRFDFRRLTVPEIEGKLTHILSEDGRLAEPDAVGLIARLAAGGMRDAESMLDQLLSSGVERLTADHVRDLLGLADAESLDHFLDALVGGDALAGFRVLDDLEDRGRDLRSFLDQSIDALRVRLVVMMASPRAGAAPAEPALVAAARRLASIDPTASGPGGLRFQLELALLDAATAGTPAATPTLQATDRGVTARPGSPVDRRPSAPIAPSVRPAESPRPAVADPAPPAADQGTPALLPEPEPSGGAAADALALLRTRWSEVVRVISRHPAAKPLIEACRPVSVEGSIVTLGFPEGQAFLRDALERRRGILEEGVGSVLGRSVAVRCVATNLEAVPEPEPDPEASRLLAEARRIFAEDLGAVGDVT